MTKLSAQVASSRPKREMVRETTPGLEPGTCISVRHQHQRGRVTRTFVHPQRGVIVEFRDEYRGGLFFARLADVWIERREERRKAVTAVEAAECGDPIAVPGIPTSAAPPTTLVPIPAAVPIARKRRKRSAPTASAEATDVQLMLF